MANTIQHKKSSVSGAVPSGSSLSYGELAVNYADGKLYTLKDDDTVINLGVSSISGTVINPVSGVFDAISFNIDNESVLTKGQISWDDTEGTMDIGLTDNTTIHLGEHRFYRIRNTTGGTLYKGQVVYATGVHSNGIITPDLYIADDSIDEVRFIGTVLEDVNDNNNGYVIDFGHLQDLDLDGSATNYAVGDETWSAGDLLYAHPTASGKLTNVEPKHSITVAIILDAGNGNGGGSMFVRPSTHGDLSDNHDVDVSGVTNGQMLRYNSSTDYWTTGVIYDNGTNVGIGTSTPSTKLHVVGVGNFGEPGSEVYIGYDNLGSDLGITTSSEYIAVQTSDSKFRYGGDGVSVGIVIDSSYNVGVGTESPTYKLQVNGSFGATTKSFRIDHPSRPNYTLEYGSLESPYHGVRLTGRGRVVKGSGVVSLPYYLKDLIHDDETINIQITNIKHGKVIYVDKIDLNNDQFTVKADRCKTVGTLEFFWTFTGTRKDVDNLVVEQEK